MKLVIPVGPIRFFHPDPVLTQVAQFSTGRPPADLSPEGGVVRGVAGHDARDAREERAVHRRRLGAEEEWIVSEQSGLVH